MCSSGPFLALVLLVLGSWRGLRVAEGQGLQGFGINPKPETRNPCYVLELVYGLLQSLSGSMGFGL